MINSMNGKSSFELNNLGSLISYRLLTLTIICIQMANEMFGSRCVRVAVENQFFRISNREREKKNGEKNEITTFSFFFMCISLAVVVPSTPSQGSDESSKIFSYYVTVTSFFSLSLQDIRDVCVY